MIRKNSLIWLRGSDDNRKLLQLLNYCKTMLETKLNKENLSWRMSLLHVKRQFFVIIIICGNFC